MITSKYAYGVCFLSAMAGFAPSAMADLTVDIRATGASGSGITITDDHNVKVAVSATGSVTMGVYGVVTGMDGILTNDGLQYVNGWIASSNIGGNASFAVKGDLAATIDMGFMSSGFSAGTSQDLDGDGDLDLGGSDVASGSGMWYPRAGNVFAMPSGGSGLHLGDLTFTLGSVNALADDSMITQIQFSPTATDIAGLWRTDGTNGGGVITGGTVDNFGSDGFTSHGVNFVVGVPEPGAIGILAVGALLAIRRRRATR